MFHWKVKDVVCDAQKWQDRSTVVSLTLSLKTLYLKPEGGLRWVQ